MRTYVSEPRDEANELRGALNHEHGTDSGLLETGFSPKNFKKKVASRRKKRKREKILFGK